MAGKTDDFEWEVEGEEASTVQVEDDTPPEDRGREPMPEDIVKELEADELEDYSEKVKLRLKQMKKVWHDERREKEREAREKSEALAAAQRLLEENRKLKETLTQGEQTLVGSFKQNAEFELAQAKREYREAYESGDADKLVEAQEKLARATYRHDQIQNYRPTTPLQDTEEGVSNQSQVQIPRPDNKTAAWQERNPWYGSDPEMTASALGLHQKLERERGPQFVGTDEYWNAIDNTMRRRFPEYFGNDTQTETPNKGARAGKPAPVVAPASRSTSSKKIVLKASQVAIARRLGLTPEQYARELMKMER
jgi:hypothetical protein